LGRKSLTELAQAHATQKLTLGVKPLGLGKKKKEKKNFKRWCRNEIHNGKRWLTGGEAQQKGREVFSVQAGGQRKYGIRPPNSFVKGILIWGLRDDKSEW